MPPAAEGILNLAEAEAAPPFYVAVVGKPRLRRLHRKGGCGTDPNDLHIMEPVFELETAAYDVACKHCWRNGRCPEDPSSVSSAQSGSDSDGEGDSSSSESVAAQLYVDALCMRSVAQFKFKLLTCRSWLSLKVSCA